DGAAVLDGGRVGAVHDRGLGLGRALGGDLGEVLDVEHVQVVQVRQVLLVGDGGRVRDPRLGGGRDSGRGGGGRHGGCDGSTQRGEADGGQGDGRGLAQAGGGVRHGREDLNRLARRRWAFAVPVGQVPARARSTPWAPPFRLVPGGDGSAVRGRPACSTRQFLAGLPGPAKGSIYDGSS